MAETAHARCRRAAILGLALQLVTAGAALLLAGATQSFAFQHLSWLLAGGVPLWFTAMLVFRQRELAALEALDLEELRREKQTAGGEALFGEAGGLGLMVARARLEWMQRWLVPALGLIFAAGMLGVGFWSWNGIQRVVRQELFRPLVRVDLALILHALLMLTLFFYSRYASGLGRVAGWQLMRACGSYMLGGAIVAAAIWIALGANLYSGVMNWERWIARGVPWLMMALGAEALLNFLLDIYRPRSPDAEPRACFDSRLLGLISEPGGIAHSLAEAINYQFGFRVSQTWFYQLLQRAALPLASVGLLTVWLMSGIVLVYPYERAIIERFGRQIRPESPLPPGVHFKAPWPIDAAKKYNTDQLHEFFVGYKAGYTPDEKEQAREPGKANIEQWTDPKHAGRDHFDFLIALPPGGAADAATAPAEEPEPRMDRITRAPVNLVRAHVVVQYRVRAERLAEYTQSVHDPDAALRNIAWDEVVRFCAAGHIDALMGPLRDEIGTYLRDRLAARADALRLGLEIVHVGMLQVHPERTVAEAFRKVVTAQQEKIAEIRKARVTENERLSEVAGDRDRALSLAQAIDQVQTNEVRRAPLERTLRGLEAAQVERVRTRLASLQPQLTARVEAEWRLQRARDDLQLVADEFELGMGRSLAQRQAAELRVQEAQAAVDAAAQAVRAALDPLLAELAAEVSPEVLNVVPEHAQVMAALDFWNGRLERSLTGLEGQAAVLLAEAQARRWELEMRAAGEVARVENERFAYQAAPEIYKKRRYLQTLVEGIKDARKYFLAFDPNGRRIHVRLETQEQARPGLAETSLEQQ
ncbi:MAG: hypothetical protein HRF50_06555 [Phycisphaerae bacterium]